MSSSVFEMMTRRRDHMPESSRETLSRAKRTPAKPNRWWLALIGFPVIAGTLCAMAIMFNICALQQGWQEVIDVDNRTSTLSSPAWATALKAVSLALATAAYILYFLTMSFNYDRVKGFTITVLGWLASSIMLFSLIGVEARQHRQIRSPQLLIYTQNFFAGIFAAGLYGLIAIVLASYIASVRSVHISPSDRQRVECTSIMLRAVSFSTIVLIGAAIYSTVEGWSFMDALYFADYTILTIGIGNFVPITHLGRSLLFPYATAGIGSLGLLIASVASFTNDMRDLKLRHALQEARNAAYGQRDLEKASNEIHTDREKQLQPVPVRAQFPKSKEVLNLHRVKSDFYRRNGWVQLIFFLLAWFVLWLVSALIFRRSEKSQGWSYFVALYFTYTSLTTIGYGDFFPTSNFGTVFFVFWSLIALPILTNLVTAMGQIFHRMLVFCSGFIWRRLFRKMRARHRHWHENVSQSPGEEGGNAINRPAMHPAAPGSGIRNKGSGRHLSMTGLVSDSAQTDEAESSSPRNDHERIRSIKASARHKLLLTEEIEALVFALRDEPLEDLEEVCCTWARILPLLHAEEHDAGTSYGVIPISDLPKPENVTMMKLMDPKKALSDRKTEYLWMLTFLLERLRSDLKKDLY